MVKITFPDGSVREYEQGVTGLQIAESISPALARNVVSCGVNGETVELNRPINEDATVELYKFDDEQGKHTFWHTSAHLLAEALQELYPGIQFGFGPLSITDSSTMSCLPRVRSSRRTISPRLRRR